MSQGPKYSVLMPTYNERENLPLITWLLRTIAEEKYYLNLFMLKLSVAK